MDLNWLEELKDPAIKKTGGRGAFLSGIVLGMVASCQVGKGGHINDAPLFKKLFFGKLQTRDIKRQLSEFPTQLKAYDIPYQKQLTELTGMAADSFLQTAYELNAWKYFYQAYPELKKNESGESNSNNKEANHEL